MDLWVWERLPSVCPASQELMERRHLGSLRQSFPDRANSMFVREPLGRKLVLWV